MSTKTSVTLRSGSQIVPSQAAPWGPLTRLSESDLFLRFLSLTMFDRSEDSGLSRVFFDDMSEFYLDLTQPADIPSEYFSFVSEPLANSHTPLSAEDLTEWLRGLDSSTTPIDEHLLNEQRLLLLGQHFTDELIELILEEDFEYGLDTRADALVRQQMQQNSLATRDWLNRMFLSNIDSIPIAVGLLRIIARFDYWDVYPQGQTMAIAALSHSGPEVQECGVRAFENWESPHGIAILNELHVSIPWLQDYIDQVVEDLLELEGELVRQED